MYDLTQQQVLFLFLSLMFWCGVTLYLHLGLNPGSDDVGLGGKLAPQSLVGLLSGHLLLEHLVSEGHKVLHLQIKSCSFFLPPRFDTTDNRLESLDFCNRVSRWSDACLCAPPLTDCAVILISLGSLQRAVFSVALT